MQAIVVNLIIAALYAIPAAAASPAKAALAVQPGGLTSEECVRRALKIAPEIEAARADIAEQEAATLRVMADYVPDVSLRASYQRTSRVNSGFTFGGDGALGDLSEPTRSVLSELGTVFDQQLRFDPPLNNYAIQATLRAPLSEYAWQIVPALRAARSNEAAADYRRQAQRLRVALSARLAFYRWLRALAHVGVAEEAVEAARARLADARQGLAAGTLAEVDVLRLEAQVGSTELALTRVISEQRIARNDLELLIGAEGSFTVGEDLFSANPQQRNSAAEQPLDKLVHRGQERRPDARALGKAMDAARDAALRSWTEYFPRLEAVGTVNYANPNQLFFPPVQEWNLNWLVALNLTWSISRFMRGHADVQRYESAERSLRAQLEQLRRAIAREVHAHWHRWKQAHTALRVSAKKLVAAQAAYDQMEKRYTAGLATTTDLIDAENTRNRAALEEVDARIDTRASKARLLSAAGYGQLARHVSHAPNSQSTRPGTKSDGQ
jgi:outer membrane protein TolC